MNLESHILQSSHIKVLLVTSIAQQADQLTQFLAPGPHRIYPDLDFNIHTVDRVKALEDQLAHEAWDVILLDLELPHLNVPEDLPKLQQMAPLASIVVSVGKGAEALGLELMAQGVEDLVYKDRLDGPQVERAVRHAFARNKTKHAFKIKEMALNALDVGLLVTNPHLPDNPIVYCNQGFEELTGYKRSEVLGENCRFMNRAVSQQDELETIRQAIAQKKPCRVTLQNVRKDGSLFWNELVLSPLFDATGEVMYLVGLQNNVTLRVELEKALAKSQERYFSMLNEIPHGIQENDLEGTITFSNKAHAQMHGYTRDEIQGTKIWDLHESEKMKEELKEYLAYLVSAQPEPAPYFGRDLKKDGTFIDVRVDWTYKRDDQGVLTGFISVITDITQLKMAEDRLSQEKARSSLILEQLTDGVAFADQKGDLIYFNQRGAEILGLGVSASTDDKWSEMFGIFDMDKVTRYPEDRLPLRRALAGETVHGVELFVRNEQIPNGKFLSVNAAPLMDSDKQEVFGAVAVFNDVTGQIESRRERNNLIDQLVKRGEEMESFAYSISHDLRAPLVTVRGLLDYVRVLKEGDTPHALADIKQAERSALHMDLMLADILEFSRVSQKPAKEDWVDLYLVMASMKNIFGVQLQEVGAELHVPDTLPRVWGSRIHLERMVQNLLENAIKYRGTDPLVVDMRIEEEADEVVLQIADNGKGLDPLYHDKAFDLFFRAEKEAEGSGTGLAIVKKIMTHLDGRVWITSAGPQKGVTLHLAFPKDKVRWRP